VGHSILLKKILQYLEHLQSVKLYYVEGEVIHLLKLDEIAYKDMQFQTS
jgi:hypothetical protein